MQFRSAWIALVLAVISVAAPRTASAQVGLLVGFNSANVDFEAKEAGGINISGDRRTGFVAGLSFNMPLRDMFSVEVDALFTQKGTEFSFEDETGKIKLNYVDLPVLAKINLPGSGPVGVHLLAGPSFNFKVSEKFDPDEDDPEDSIEKMETALVIGGGVHVSRFRIDLRYGVGLTNIVKDSASDGFFTGKNKVFSILVGI